MWKALKSLFTRRRITYSVDAEGIARFVDEGRDAFVRWDELERVEIVTTDDGPWAEDVFWLLRTRTGGLVVPGESEVAYALLGWFERLPGFDHAAVIEAMGCADHARFLAWKRADAEADPVAPRGGSVAPG